MTNPNNKKPKKDKEPEVDLTQFTPDEIAKRFLESPPKPKDSKKKKEKKD